MTGTGLSENAVKKAKFFLLLRIIIRSIAADKVLNCKIKEKAFDYIFLTEDAFMY